MKTCWSEQSDRPLFNRLEKVIATMVPSDEVTRFIKLNEPFMLMNARNGIGGSDDLLAKMSSTIGSTKMYENDTMNSDGLEDFEMHRTTHQYLPMQSIPPKVSTSPTWSITKEKILFCPPNQFPDKSLCIAHQLQTFMNKMNILQWMCLWHFPSFILNMNKETFTFILNKLHNCRRVIREPRANEMVCTTTKRTMTISHWNWLKHQMFTFFRFKDQIAVNKSLHACENKQNRLKIKQMKT